ncbi:MAG TPA: response regulator transcription factor [Candidatus Aminicenantes bacterium]|nr:response regulator transcription factor [Candidatus Aminicenantes bacterium]HRY63881.1 response regulator transcription factor [Candidatus Aminicenantes bacterium]HRZ70794.1 response regulator transcription factor [Candidatus Aminicenantes bacterium]
MSKKILLVDDDRDLVASLAQVLRTNGYDVAAAHSGAEGLKALLAERPDLVILDVMMETDTAGFEAADVIRSRRDASKYREFRDVPIIILTAIDQVTNSRFSMDQADSFLPGTNEFLTKPVDLDELLAKVGRALR